VWVSSAVRAAFGPGINGPPTRRTHKVRVAVHSRHGGIQNVRDLPSPRESHGRGPGTQGTWCVGGGGSGRVRGVRGGGMHEGKNPQAGAFQTARAFPSPPCKVRCLMNQGVRAHLAAIIAMRSAGPDAGLNESVGRAGVSPPRGTCLVVEVLCRGAYPAPVAVAVCNQKHLGGVLSSGPRRGAQRNAQCDTQQRQHSGLPRPWGRKGQEDRAAESFGHGKAHIHSQKGATATDTLAAHIYSPVEGGRPKNPHN
jgi:hypothetical protein